MRMARRSCCEYPLKIIGTFLAIGLAMTTNNRTHAHDDLIVTKIACETPEVPILILEAPLPSKADILDEALRLHICRDANQKLPVFPVKFLQVVETSFGSQEPFAYLWAFRLDGESVEYWYFWQEQHNKLLKKARNI